MARGLERSVKKSTARKQATLEKFAKMHYGERVTLADLHPDCKYIMGLAIAVYRARLGKDVELQERVLQLMDAFVTQIVDQVDTLTPEVAHEPSEVGGEVAPVASGGESEPEAAV